MKIEAIALDNNNNIFVEVVDINISDEVREKMKKQFSKPSQMDGLADDAEEVGLFDDVKMSMDLIKYDLSNIAKTVKESFKENQPNEFSVEVNFSFAGELAIPYITSAKSNAGIKVKAIWKKDN